MNTEIPRCEVHGEFGKAIYAAKKKLYADSKAGVDLQVATENFMQHLGSELYRILATAHVAPKERGRGVNTEEEADRQAKTVAAILDELPTPDFITTVVMQTIDDAFAYYDLHLPEDQQIYTAEDLKRLFLKTRFLSLDDLYPESASAAAG